MIRLNFMNMEPEQYNWFQFKKIICVTLILLVNLILVWF